MRDKDLHAELWLETESSLQGVGRGLQRATGLLRAAKTVALTVLRGFCKGRGPRRAQTGSGRGQVQEGSRSQGPGVSSPMTTPLVYFKWSPGCSLCGVCPTAPGLARPRCRPVQGSNSALQATLLGVPATAQPTTRPQGRSYYRGDPRPPATFGV